MSKVVQRGAVAPTMNITPLIDVVFLLIIFFMLVSKIVSDQTVEMIVPEFDDAKVRELADETPTIIVNIAPQTYTRANREGNPLEFAGDPAFVKVGSYPDFALNDLAGITNALKTEVAKNEKVEVLLRADGALFYEAVQPIMGAITSAGIETVNLVAYLPEE